MALQAYLESNEDVIREHCSPEMIERLTGIMRAQKQQVRGGSNCCSLWSQACVPCCLAHAVPVPTVPTCLFFSASGIVSGVVGAEHFIM
jgi:hypothetical protein